MALFLIKDRDAVHADPEKDRRGCYKAGDIVEVLDDSKHDGDLVANPIAAPFYLVHISGLTKEQALRFMESRMHAVSCRECTGTGFVEDPETHAQVFCPRCQGMGLVNEVHTRREWNIPIDSLPAGVQASLVTTRYYETTLAAVRAYVRNKRTGETA